MSENYFIKPAKGIKLYDPETRNFINPEGQRVKKSSYWTRRITEGSAIEISQARPAPAGPKNEAAAPAAPAVDEKSGGDGDQNSSIPEKGSPGAPAKKDKKKKNKK